MIAKKYPHLFSPIKIGPLTLRNRIEAAPTSLAELSAEGYLTRENIAYYKLKARAGLRLSPSARALFIRPQANHIPQAVRTGYDAAMTI